MYSALEKLIMKAGDIPTIPVVATRILQLMEDPMTTAEDLARAVAADPAVAARVMKISNSSFYGCQRQVQTLSGAVMVLGFSTLKSLVIAASVKEIYRPFGLTEKMLWEHSFGAGLAARIIARSTRMVNEEEAFLGGLFHDIGKIVMNTLDRENFQLLMQKVYNENVLFWEAERDVFPYTHAEAGGLVIRKWNFPEVLVTAVSHHHDFILVDECDPYAVTLTAVTALANQFCHRYGVGLRSPDPLLDLSATLANREHLRIPSDRMEEIAETFARTFEQDRSFFT
ncbi:MAG: HDOD domain-containing protein [Desulfuromonadia bacterium]